MNEKRMQRLRIGVTGLITIAIWALLLWRHLDGGVPAHHLLQNPDLPVVSDWFGGVLLPLLAWFLIGRISRRVGGDRTAQNGALVGLIGGVIFGAVLSVTFVSGHSEITGYLFYSPLLLALLLPVHRAECLLGFVLGMCLTFGAVLPTLVGSLLVGVALLIHRFLRPGLLWLFGRRVNLGQARSEKSPKME